MKTGPPSARAVKAPPAGYQDPIPNKDYPYITVEWPLQEYLVVGYDGIVEERGGGGVPMAVQVPVRSMADTQLFFQYRFQKVRLFLAK